MSSPSKEIIDTCTTAEILFHIKPKTLADLKLILTENSVQNPSKTVTTTFDIQNTTET